MQKKQYIQKTRDKISKIARVESRKNDTKEINRDQLMQDLVGHGKEFRHYHGDKGKPMKGVNKGEI